MKFSRFIDNDFVEALNQLYHHKTEGAWWRNFLADPDIFVAVRDGSLNAYYRGCSLARIWLEGKEVRASTHYKYLLRPTAKPTSIEARAGRFRFPASWQQGLDEIFIGDLSETPELKRAATPYVGAEKKFVGEIIKRHTNVFLITHEPQPF